MVAAPGTDPNNPGGPIFGGVMAKAMRAIGDQWRVVEVPELPRCPRWCEGLDEFPCWGHDLHDAWTVSHAKSVGAGVAVVQTGRWTPSAGLTMDAAEGAVEYPDDNLFSPHEIRLLIEALGRAIALIEEINAARSPR